MVGIGYIIIDPSNLRTLRGANVVTLDSSALDSYEVSGCQSECFYSTKKDSGVTNKIKVLTDYKDYQNWFEKYHDIQLVAPSSTLENQAGSQIENGFYAVVVSLPDLFDTEHNVLATAKYQNEDNDLLITLGQRDRDPIYKYDDNLTNAKAIYTTIYLDKNVVKNATDIAFAVDAGTGDKED